MKTDIEVTVTGLPFDEKAVTGITISYGINSIPSVSLALDAPYIQNKNAEFLCNPNIYKTRERTVEITVKAKTGCLKFTGYFDGLSISQSPGNFSYTANFKNKFQRLLEIYPRFCGVTSSSCRVFRAVEHLTIQQGHPEATNLDYQVSTAFSMDMTKSLGEFLVQYFQLLVKSQFIFKANTNLSPTVDGLLKIIKDKVYAANVAEAIPLLQSCVTKYIEKCEIKGVLSAQSLLEMMQLEHTSLWDLMTQMFDYVGCALIVADEKLFVIPKTNFLKIDHGKPVFQGKSDRPNVANPTDYNYFSVSDSGYSNVKYCYVLSRTYNLPGGMRAQYDPLITNYMGIYPPDGVADPEIPDDGSSGIHIVSADPFLMSGLDYQYCSNPVTQRDLASGTPLAGDIVTRPRTVADDLAKVHERGVSNLEKQRKLLDAYAKLQFLQVKYSDRCGQFSALFNTQWAPGSTGSLYSRVPGIFTHFYVTSVTHTIAMNAPGNGTAVTQVSFNSARSGSLTKVPGINQDDLYKYSSKDMVKFQKEWIQDITP